MGEIETSNMFFLSNTPPCNFQAMLKTWGGSRVLVFPCIVVQRLVDSTLLNIKQ